MQIKTHYSWFEPERKARGVFMRSRLPLAVCLLAYFTSVGDSAREGAVWSLLEKPLLDCEDFMAGWWRERRFEPFFVSLYAKERGHAVPLELGQCDLKVYGRVLTAWNDDEVLADALASA